MALTLELGATLVSNTAFKSRVAMAFYYVARSVVTEAAGTPGHENRDRFARSIVFQPYEAFLQYAAMVITDPDIIAASPTVAAPPTDAQIVAAVTRMWNTLSNVEA